MVDKFIFVFPDGETIEEPYSISDLLTMTVCGALLRHNGKEYKVIKSVKELGFEHYTLKLYMGDSLD